MAGMVNIGTVAEELAGQTVQNFPGGDLKVCVQPRQMLGDVFDTDELINTWVNGSGGGGVAPSVATGSLVLATGTTANGYSYRKSQFAFKENAPGWIRHGWVINLESPIIANSYRFFGTGIPVATPIVANPMNNGAGFEVYTDGKLYAVTYVNGTRTVVKDLNASGQQPLNTALHNYIMYYRGTKIYYYIDNSDVPVATSTLAQNPLIGSLPHLFLAIAGSTPPASSAVLTCPAMSVSDTAANANTICDPSYSWRRAFVNAYGGMGVYPAASPTYTATFQLAASSSVALSNVFAGAGAKQYATIFHSAAAVKLVRIRKVEVSLTNVSAAALVAAQLAYLTNATTPATGNPAITPCPHNPAASAAEVTCLSLPGTAGTIGNYINAQEFNAGVEVAATGLNTNQTIVLYSDTDGQSVEPLIIRPLTAEGYTVNIGCSAAATVKAVCRITFTEEPYY